MFIIQTLQSIGFFTQIRNESLNEFRFQIQIWVFINRFIGLIGSRYQPLKRLIFDSIGWWRFDTFSSSNFPNRCCWFWLFVCWFVTTSWTRDYSSVKACLHWKRIAATRRAGERRLWSFQWLNHSTVSKFLSLGRDLRFRLRLKPATFQLAPPWHTPLNHCLKIIKMKFDWRSPARPADGNATGGLPH